MRNTYIIYGKEIDNGDFMPFHTRTGSLIKSEFWASYWTEEHKEEAQEAVDELNNINDKFIFELRKRELK